MTIDSGNLRGRMVASGSKGNLACAFLDTAPVDGHDDRLCFSVVRRLFLHRLTPLVTFPALCISRSLDVAGVIIESCHRGIGIRSDRHVVSPYCPVRSFSREDNLAQHLIPSDTTR